MKKLPLITIAVCAYNEEKNIGKLLNSVLMQKQVAYVIDKILIVSDGSTDKTTEKVKDIKSDKVSVISHKKREGKSARLNQIYQKVNTDILVQLDADVILSHENVIGNLVRPLINNVRVGMCGGNPTPVSGVTFTEKAINLTAEVYIKFRKIINKGNNVFSADGRILAYKKDLYKQFVIPEDMIANDAFTYFVCLSSGFEYRYVPTAIVWFRSPQSLRDQVRQNTRFTAAPARMKRYFANALIDQEYHIPVITKYKSLTLQFLKSPVACMYIYTVNLYCKLKARQIEKRLTAKWAMADTSKSI